MEKESYSPKQTRDEKQAWSERLPLRQQLVTSAHRPSMCSLQGVPVSNSYVRIKTTLGQREEISEKLSSVHSRILFICSAFTRSTNTHLIMMPMPRKRRVSAAMFTSSTRSRSAAEKTTLSAPRPSGLANTGGYTGKRSDPPCHTESALDV